MITATVESVSIEPGEYQEIRTMSSVHHVAIGKPALMLAIRVETGSASEEEMAAFVESITNLKRIAVGPAGVTAKVTPIPEPKPKSPPLVHSDEPQKIGDHW